MFLEHRNLTLEDGYQILLTNYRLYKEELENKKVVYPELNSNEDHQTIKICEKFPLPMLLGLLADGRQLTLEEIDRVLSYLLEKKAKMLTLPQGTLPPLPVQYANCKFNFLFLFFK